MKSLDEYSLQNDWSSFLSFRERKLRGTPTGIELMDKSLLGLGGITMIVGAPGSMKSSLVLQIAYHNAAQGTPAFIIDRENGRERFRLRLLCQANNIGPTEVMTCSKEKLREYVEKVMGLPIYACTDPITDFGQIQNALSSLQGKYKKPMLLVVDSLQALPHIDVDERMSIQRWLMHFDQAKLDFEGKLTTLITSEKKRGDNEYERASLSSAKGSGTAEYKSEMVIDLRRDKVTGNIIAEITKNRDGASNQVFMLEPVLANTSNKASFCFKLRGAEAVVI